ncbi:hypothetical protein BBK36DRAFT_1137390 [Trichoderma citrinoviride]|uniref:Uncharacterized protein n=1 Tax=Trichoderma citrinoviride TaxID=58853 RepID=A0A2T4BN33_9HYPO|nr:hypothetical protein BBK36DRAFT_1137390 [Trichoderma citrinoviride]PTB70734.1 hypothetical protein BBK36DRAFT_1137390 [Trichoderma citrinoviride]
MPPKRRLPIHQKDAAREIAETPGPEPSSSSPSSPPAQKAKREEERPVSLRNAPGNVRWVDGDLNGNVAGIASIAFVAVSMLETLSAGNADAADRDEIKTMLKYIGGADALDQFRKNIHDKFGSFGPKPTVFRNFFEGKAWEANKDVDIAETQGEPTGGREASVELGSTPAPTTLTEGTTTAGREGAGSAELGAAPQEAAATPVVIPSDPETSDEPLDSSDEPLALKRAKAAEKAAVTSKYFGAGGAGGAGGKA